MRLSPVVVVSYALALLAACQQPTEQVPASGAPAAGSGGGAGTSAPGTDGGGSQVEAPIDGAAAQADGGAPLADGGDAVDAAVEPPVSPEIARLSQKLAGAMCAALLECLGAAKLTELTGREDCATRKAAELRARELAYLQDAFDDGRVQYDDTKLDACTTGIAQLGCAIATDELPAACDELLAGQVAVGAACTSSLDCAGTAFCAMQACPYRCADLLPKGASCHNDEECGDDLLCVSGKCVTPARGGQPCLGSSGNVCALGFSCWNANPPTPGVCHSRAETQAGARGEVCEPGGKLCQEGLSCVWGGTLLGQFHCEAPVASGAACHQGLPGQCPVTEYCASSSVTTAGTCEPLPADGQACVGSGVCAAKHVCVPDGTGGICRPVQPNGGKCKIDAACRSNFCNAGICEPPPVCE